MNESSSWIIEADAETQRAFADRDSGEIASAQARLRNANRLYERALPLRPLRGQEWTARGFILGVLGESLFIDSHNAAEARTCMELALSSHHQALQADDAVALSHNYKAKALLTLGDIEAEMGDEDAALTRHRDALEEVDLALRQVDDVVAYYRTKAYVLMKLMTRVGRLESAAMFLSLVATVETGLALDPRDSELLRIKKLLAQRGR
jgi:tetratricopeptide (TPR) repeat protein